MVYPAGCSEADIDRAYGEEGEAEYHCTYCCRTTTGYFTATLYICDACGGAEATYDPTRS